MERIAELRKERGWSQVKLGAVADVNPSTVNQIERGLRHPNSTTLEKLADALDVEVADLFGKAEVPKAPAPQPNPEDAVLSEAGEEALATLYRALAKRGQYIADRSVREGASEELGELAADYHREAAALAVFRGKRDITGGTSENLANAIDEYEETESRIQRLLAQDVGDAPRAQIGSRRRSAEQAPSSESNAS